LFNNWKCIHFHGESSRKNKTITVMSKTEVIKSAHIYIQNHYKNLSALSLHSILILSRSIDLIFGSIFSTLKRKIFVKCFKYWKNGLLKGDWSSNKVLKTNY